MTKERRVPESVRNLASKQAEARSTSYQMSMSAPSVVDSSKQAWQRYSECRLRQFATGR